MNGTTRKVLSDFIMSHEDWLIDRILQYSIKTGYAEYTSTLREAWKASICGLSQPLSHALLNHQGDLDLYPGVEEDTDSITQFGIEAARRHRSRGITLPMFLGLTQYYRKAYDDLTELEGFPKELEKTYRDFLNLFFDRIIVAFTHEWSQHNENEIIDELQVTNKAITNEKNRLLTILESINSPVFLVNEHYQILYCNSSASEFITGKKTAGQFYYNENEIYLPFIEDVLKRIDQDESIYFDHTYRGKYHQWNVRISNMLDSSCKYQGTLLYFTDISELVNTNKKLELYTRALNSTENAVFITDTEGTMIWVNDAFCSMAGFTREQAIGNNPRIMNSGKQSADHYRLLWDTIKSGKTWSGRVINKKHDGTLYYVDQSITPVFDNDQEVECFIAIHNDQSDYIELQHHTDHLNSTIQKMETMVAAISHDIRTPVAGIKISLDSVIQVMKMTKANEQLIETLENSKSQTDRLTSTINNTLDMMKLSGGDIQWKWKSVNLNEIIECCIQLIAKTNGASPITYEPTEPNQIMGDQRALFRIVSNLLNNSVKYSPNNNISISTNNTMIDGKPHITIHVLDEGCGISKRRMEHLGKPYAYHYGLTDHESNEGNGLGLYICNTLANLFEGWIEVISQKEKGCCIRVTLRSDLASPHQASATKAILTSYNDPHLVLSHD